VRLMERRIIAHGSRRNEGDVDNIVIVSAKCGQVSLVPCQGCDGDTHAEPEQFGQEHWPN
jgi:hypothetical protein